MNNYLEYSNFEELLSTAFPLDINSKIDWSSNRVSREAEEIFGSKNWREMVGFQLGLLDCSFSSNLELLPIEAVAYYLPAFLLSAAMQFFHADNEVTFPSEIVDGLYLAIPDSIEQRERVDHLFCTCGLVSSYPEGRLKLFRALNIEQRKCVADFLLLYAKYFAEKHDKFFQPGSRECYMEIVECWKFLN